MQRLQYLLLFICIFLISGIKKDNLALASMEATTDSPWLDSSAKIFLPSSLGSQFEAQQFFPVLWWNFLVLKFENQESGFRQISELCDRLHALPKTVVAKTGCGQNLDQFKPLLADWSEDQFVRNQAPSPEVYSKKLNNALAKASLPEGGDILTILRMDPLESYKELLNHVESRVRLKFPKKFGFLIDEKMKMIVLPIQFGFPPFDVEKTHQFKMLQDEYAQNLKLIGPHSSTYENQMQVTRDLRAVSMVGTLLLLLLGFAVLVSKRWKLLLIVPPVLFSTILSTLLTVLIFGSIHGLTLAFGTGIIGIAIDFGLHSVFNRNYKGIWRANAFGLYTTIGALIIMMFSSIPLLRQIMVFSILGIATGYTILYLCELAFPKLFEVKPIAISPKSSPAKFSFAAGLVLFSFIGIGVINLSLDMSRFDFQDDKSQNLNAWLFQNVDSNPPLFQINDVDKDKSPLDFSHAQKKWAEQNKVRYEGIANLIPSKPVQKNNLKSWSTLIESEKTLVTPLQKIIFEPFLQQQKRAALRSLQTDDPSGTPRYIADFQHAKNKNSWISMWLPKLEQEDDMIKAEFPGALSMKEVVSAFPKILFLELFWMTPLAILLTIFLLGLYYRKLYPTLLCLIPFFSGLGLFCAAALLFHYDTSFITLIGFMMVFGFSVDYGIFATDLVIGKDRSIHGVWSALSMSALIAALGFLPLMFCKHPVLLQLGQPLVLGTIGSYIGTAYGIPGCVKYLKNFKVKSN